MMVQDPDAVLESALRRLAGIGPRPLGSTANDDALGYVEAVLRSLGMTVVPEPFTARAPQPRGAATTTVDGASLACVPFLESVAGEVIGELHRVDNCKIWGMHDTQVWMVHDDGREAAITVPPFPTPIQQHIPPDLAGTPSVITAASDAQGILREGATARVAVGPAPAGVTSRSLRAYFGSKDPLGARRHTVVVAHIDTVPDSPGVYDNAAGVAAALSVCARRPDASWQLLITNAEEEGLAGARQFLQRARSAGTMSTLAATIVLDGGGRSRDAEVWLDGGLSAGSVLGRLTPVAETMGYRLTHRQPAPPASDHAAFIEAGIPALMLTVNDLEIIHTTHDVYEPPKLESARVLAGFAAQLLTGSAWATVQTQKQEQQQKG